jgi:hypothetical protein
LMQNVVEVKPIDIHSRAHPQTLAEKQRPLGIGPCGL